jgi:transposase
VQQPTTPNTLEEAVKVIKLLWDHIVKLEAKISQDSSNSSKPPSSDPPEKNAPPVPLRNSSGRKRGGQQGHQKHARTLVPIEEVDRQIPLKPKSCRRCGEKIFGNDPSPYRHQVFDIPPIKAMIHEYQLHTLHCRCGEKTRADLPAGVPHGQFGSRLQAVVSICSGAYRLSKRAIQELVSDFFNINISLGT